MIVNSKHSICRANQAIRTRELCEVLGAYEENHFKELHGQAATRYQPLGALNFFHGHNGVLSNLSYMVMTMIIIILNNKYFYKNNHDPNTIPSRLSHRLSPHLNSSMQDHKWKRGGSKRGSLCHPHNLHQPLEGWLQQLRDAGSCNRRTEGWVSDLAFPLGTRGRLACWWVYWFGSLCFPACWCHSSWRTRDHQIVRTQRHRLKL